MGIAPFTASLFVAFAAVLLPKEGELCTKSKACRDRYSLPTVLWLSTWYQYSCGGLSRIPSLTPRHHTRHSTGSVPPSPRGAPMWLGCKRRVGRHGALAGHSWCQSLYHGRGPHIRRPTHRRCTANSKLHSRSTPTSGPTQHVANSPCPHSPAPTADEGPITPSGPVPRPLASPRPTFEPRTTTVARWSRC